jgi:hypothetical protein
VLGGSVNLHEEPPDPVFKKKIRTVSAPNINETRN